MDRIRRAAGMRVVVRSAIVTSLLLLGTIGLLVSRAGAAPSALPHGVNFTSGNGGGVIKPVQQTYGSLKSALTGASSQPTVQVSVSGMPDVSLASAELDADDTDFSLTAFGTVDATTDTAFTNSPLKDLAGAATTEVLLVVQYPDATSKVPTVALAFQADGITLQQIDSDWTGAGYLNPALPKAALLLAPANGSLDTSVLPSSLKDVLGITSGDRSFDVTTGANLFADVDVSGLPAVQKVAELLGASSSAAHFDVVGQLGDSSNFVFNSGALTSSQLQALSLDIPIPSSTPATWLSIDNAGLQLSISGGAAAVNVHGDFTVDVDNTTNTFTLDSGFTGIVPDPGSPPASFHLDFGLASSQSALNLPFGLDWLTVSSPKLSLDFDPSGPTFGAELAGDLTIGTASVSIDIAIEAGGGKVAGEVSVTGEVPLGDVATWLDSATGSPFSGAGFDTSALNHITLTTLDFTFDSSGPTFTLLAGVQLAGNSADASVDLSALVSVSGTGASSQLLFGIRAAPTAGQDVKLGDFIPGLGTSFAADMRMPEAALVLALPANPTFDTTAMSDPARDFLASAFDSDTLPDELDLTAQLHFYANLDLGWFGDTALGILGIDTNDPTLHIEGALGFDASEYGGTGAPSLSSVDLTASLPAGGFSWLPSWVTFSGDWTFGIQYDAGESKVKVSVESPAVTITVPDSGDPEQTFTANLGVSFAKTADGAVEAEVHGALTDWNEPFGISWLDLTSLEFVATASKEPGEPVAFDFNLDAQATLGTKDVSVSLHVGNGTNEVCGSGVGSNATISLSLGSAVTVDDVLSGIFGSNYASSLGSSFTFPAAVTSASFGPATIEATVCPTSATATDAKFVVDATVQTSFEPFSGTTINLDAMFYARFPQTGSATVAFGIRPTLTGTDPITLSDLLPGVVDTSSPLNFQLFDPSSDDTGFAIVFSNAALSSATIPDLVKDWLKPIEGLGPSDTHAFSVPAGLGVVGAIQLPEPLSTFAGDIGMSDKVLLSGTFPIGGTNFSGLALRLELHSAQSGLPAWMHDFSLHFQMSVGTSGFEMDLGGDITLALQQGFPAGAADALSNIGITIPRATVVAANATCPRNGVVQAASDGHMYCHDLVKVGIDGMVSITDDSTNIDVTGSLSSVKGDGSPNLDGWSPFGLTDVSVTQFLVSTGFHLDPTGFSIDFGMAGSLSLFNKQMNGAFDIEIRPIEVFPFVEIDPKGFRFSFPNGLSVSDILSIANRISGQHLSLGSLPNIAVRNLLLSISPEGVQKLCIAQGFEIGGDLYLNPQGSGPTQGVSCDPSTGILTQPPAAERCGANTGDGCLVGVHLVINDSGIDGTGHLAAFDAGPLHWEGADIRLKVSSTQQLLKLSGGIHLGSQGSPYASGQFAINFSAGLGSGSNPPIHTDFYGKLQIFSFKALVWGGLDVNPLTLFSGGTLGGTLDLHFALATDAHVQGADELDFASAVSSSAGPVVASLNAVIDQFESIVDDLVSDPGQALKDLKQYLVDNGATIPSWMSSAIDQIADILSAANAVGIQPALNAILNGVNLPGLDGIRTPGFCAGAEVAGTCYGVRVPATCIVVVVNGHCYSIPPITIPGVCDLSVFSNITAFNDGCTVQEFAHEILFEPIKTVLDKVVTGITTAASTVLSVLSGGTGGLFALNCASFDLHLSTTDPSSTQLGLAISATILGSRGGFAFSWNFGASIASNINSFVNSVFDAIAHPGSVTCSSPDVTLFGSTGTTGTGTTPAVLQSLDLSSTVNEASAATLTGHFDRALAAARTVSVTWGDGNTQSVSVAIGATSFTTTHTYADDNPTATAHDVYNVSAHDTSSGGATLNKSLTVNNVAPSGVTLTPGAGVNEGGTASLHVSFTDPGTADTHTVSILWGDGATSQVSLGAGVLSTTVDPTHVYRDDPPSGTASDQVPVGVTVTDDDTGRGTGSTTITVNNRAPVLSSSSLSPTTVDEGSTVNYTISFTDAGVLDTHIVQVDFDGDGIYESVQTLAAGVTTATLSWNFGDDNPTATPQDIDNVQVLVTDDDTGSATRTIPVTVRNVAPTITNLSLTASTIAENTSVTLNGTFTDPGLVDTYTVGIDWGSTQVVGPTTLSIPLTNPETRTFQATATYGDNGTYPIGVTLTDDDTGATTGAQSITVTNVDPTSAIDRSNAVAAGNGPTMITTIGQSLGFSARSTDPGSDDLTLTWTWDLSNRFDHTTTATTYKVNPPANDPLLSPSVQPRDITDSHSHTWTQACLYTVKARSVDDDTGSASDQVPLVVQGNAALVYGPGSWYQNYRTGNPKINATTAQCYLDVVGQMSRVYQERFDASTPAGAKTYLNTSGVNDPRRLLGSQVLASWLNFANGSLHWTQRVDTDCNGVNDATFSQVMHQVEDVFLNQAATKSQLLAQKAILACINGI